MKPYKVIGWGTIKEGTKLRCSLENDYAVIMIGCCGNERKVLIDPEYYRILSV